MLRFDRQQQHSVSYYPTIKKQIKGKRKKKRNIRANQRESSLESELGPVSDVRGQRLLSGPAFSHLWTTVHQHHHRRENQNF